MHESKTNYKGGGVMQKSRNQCANETDLESKFRNETLHE